ncbi:sirohydrochlorin nickelochelatase [Methanosalsum natronophilum]|uniref:Sirohydrochlorin cobaltochelatase n=1 Tax=Methanosalsum natronophilum TaxID=768733 RepID=A0A424YXC1_9EURY|nr:sirohydrochlorin nickelochelatase [Methanosalsum natronophilum]MCS3923055.1 sirohydrochlorin cobaltochelatase [Methanosalsum natronophilum]RQD85095.1 MAG: sirohydrochlorin nickelochelatase [Methanosalsum natronophilum]
MNEKIGILAIGHGSRLPYNKEVVTSIATLIDNKYPEVIVKAGFMEHCGPSVEEALESFKGTGVDKIVAVPVFLASGVHITKDIPKILQLNPDTHEGSVKLDGKEIPLLYGKPLGDHELIADLVYTRVQEVL